VRTVPDADKQNVPIAPSYKPRQISAENPLDMFGDKTLRTIRLDLAGGGGNAGHYTIQK
jgi:hypothetical protein